jgi:hypothetical protein
MIGLASAGSPILLPTGDRNRWTLGPADHVRLLHPEGRRGIITVASGGRNWVEGSVALAQLPAYVSTLAGRSDLFISQQSFYGWRRIAQLAQLGANYVDLDYHQTLQWSKASPEYVTDALLRTLQDEKIPSPSYVLDTGRGLLAVWLHDLVPRAALPRWMAIQRRLALALNGYGADVRALDAARVFRLAGTTNSKSRRMVRPIYLAGGPSTLWRWDFEDLAHEVLPRHRPEIISLSVHRAEKLLMANADQQIDQCHILGDGPHRPAASARDSLGRRSAIWPA